MPETTQKEVFRIHIRGTIQDVWKEITKTDSVQQCFFNMRLVTPGLKPGAPMQMHTKSGKYVGAIGEVLEIDPPRKYSHSFRFTNMQDPPCRVTYELQEKDGGVEFTMTLDHLTPGSKSAKQMKQGGTMIINTLKNLVERGQPAFGIRLLYTLFAVMEPFTGKALKKANWPLETADSGPRRTKL